MELRVSLPDGDVALLDYARKNGMGSRSATLHGQIRSVDCARLGPPVARLGTELVRLADGALRLHLALRTSPCEPGPVNLAL